MLTGGGHYCGRSPRSASEPDFRRLFVREEVQVARFSTVTRSTAVDSPAVPVRFLCRWQRGAFGAAWVLAAGELSPATSPRLCQTLAEAQLCARLVVLDLRELTSIDGSGLDVILDAAEGARRYGGRLMLVRPPGEVDRELTLSGASDQVLVFDLDPAEPARSLLDVG